MMQHKCALLYAYSTQFAINIKYKFIRNIKFEIISNYSFELSDSRTYIPYPLNSLKQHFKTNYNTFKNHEEDFF